VLIFAINSFSPWYLTSVDLFTLHFNQIIFPSRNLVQYQVLEHEGDLIVSDNETRIIENCEYRVIGNVTVEDNATLIIRNAIFNQTGLSIVIKNQANFYLTNATLMMTQTASSDILVINEAEIYITNSKVENPNGRVIIWGENHCIIHIENSIMQRVSEGMERCVIVSDHYSEVHIKNSTLERETIWGNSKVFIEKTILRDAMRVFGSTIVHAKNSTIEYLTVDGNASIYFQNSVIKSYIRAGENSNVWLMHMTVPEVWAGGNATINLVDASVKTLHISDKATLFVGWDLPFFGPVVFLPILAFAIQVIVLVLLAAGVAILLFLLAKKLRKQSLRKT
jgi:hypothetical protein